MLRSGHSPAAEFSVLAHEVAHELLRAYSVNRGWAYWHWGHLYASEDRLHEAEESYREAVASFEMQSSPTGVLIHRGLVYAQELLVDVLVKTGYDPRGFGSS